MYACLLHRSCHFNLPSVEAEEERHSKMPPIKVKFEIPYFTVSGMQVRGEGSRRQGQRFTAGLTG